MIKKLKANVQINYEGKHCHTLCNFKDIGTHHAHCTLFEDDWLYLEMVAGDVKFIRVDDCLKITGDMNLRTNKMTVWRKE